MIIIITFHSFSLHMLSVMSLRFKPSIPLYNQTGLVPSKGSLTQYQAVGFTQDLSVCCPSNINTYINTHMYSTVNCSINTEMDLLGQAVDATCKVLGHGATLNRLDTHPLQDLGESAGQK